MPRSSKPPLSQSEQSPVQEDAHRDGQIVHQRAEMSFSGPLPPPNVLSAYEDLLPGAADRIITMAEKQMEHRMYLEKQVIEGGNKRASMGIFAAVFVEAMFIGASCYLAHLGHNTAAIEVMGGSAVSLLAAFGFGTVSRRNERQQKQKQLTRGSDDPSQ